MEQTRLMLENARNDIVDAPNILMLLLMGELPATADNLMYAYMVAYDWCEWIKNPKAYKDNPLYGKKADYTPMLDMFERYRDDMAKVIKENETGIFCIFAQLHSNLTTFFGTEISESTKLYLRSLRLTAQLFEKDGDKVFTQILNERQAPPIEQL